MNAHEILPSAEAVRRRLRFGQMNPYRRYFLPGCIAFALLSILLSLEGPAARAVRSDRDTSSGAIRELFVPHGRALYVVVEENGVYIGHDFVPFDGLEGFIDVAIRRLKPDCALVHGTELARYGRLVNVFTRVHKALGVETQLRRSPVPVGTRRGPIEVHEHHWQYD